MVAIQLSSRGAFLLLSYTPPEAPQKSAARPRLASLHAGAGAPPRRSRKPPELPESLPGRALLEGSERPEAERHPAAPRHAPPISSHLLQRLLVRDPRRGAAGEEGVDQREEPAEHDAEEEVEEEVLPRRQPPLQVGGLDLVRQKAEVLVRGRLDVRGALEEPPEVAVAPATVARRRSATRRRARGRAGAGGAAAGAWAVGGRTS